MSNPNERALAYTPRQPAETIPPLTVQRVQDDTQLIVGSYALTGGTYLRVRARILADDGSIRYIDEPHATVGDRALHTSTHLLTAGLLLDVSLTITTGTIFRGNLYAVVSLCQGVQGTVQHTQPIAKGYVCSNSGLIYPGGAWQDSVEGPGYLRSGAIGNPAAGAEFAIPIASGLRVKLRGVTAQLVTSGVAGTRVVTAIIDDGATTLFAIPYATGQITGLIRQYYWNAFGSMIGLVGTGIYIPVPMPFSMATGWRFRTSTAALDAGDQWSGIQYCTEELMES